MEVGSFHDGLCVPTSAWACREGGVMRSMRKMNPPERLWGESFRWKLVLVCLRNPSTVAGGRGAAGGFAGATFGPMAQGTDLSVHELG